MRGKSFLGCAENAASPVRHRNLLSWRLKAPPFPSYDGDMLADVPFCLPDNPADCVLCEYVQGNADARRRQIVEQVCEVSPQPQYIGIAHSKPGNAKKFFAR